MTGHLRIQETAANLIKPTLNNSNVQNSLIVFQNMYILNSR